MKPTSQQASDTDGGPEDAILIIGCGWLGVPLGRALAGAGRAVHGSTTGRGRFEEIAAAGIRPFLLRLDPEPSEDSLRPLPAASTAVISIPPRRRRSDVEEFHPRQILALRDLLEESGVRRVVFLSSTSVYPSGVEDVFSEDDMREPDSPSGRALRKAELILCESPVFRTTVLRLGGLVGADRHPARFLAGKRDLPSPNSPVNLIHREDAVGIVLAVMDKGLWGETLNAVSSGHPAKRDFYTAQARRLGLEPPTFAAGDTRGGKTVSNEKLLRRLRYTFRYPDPSLMFMPPG